jgi:ATP-dependent protease ClpP protease subunit
MTIRKMPEAKTFARPQNFQWDAPSDVLARWAERPLAAESDDQNTISIYDVIGEDLWSGNGFTAKRASAALRSIGKNPVTVRINSPGGDMFEGIAIYNLLREHPAKVTVDVMGWAASAASIIAMAGDEIRMGLGTFMMVHNAWGMVVGNRHDMRDAADLFETFDGAIADIYAARASIDRKAIEKLMDAETFMGPTEAVEKGFADSIADDLKADEANAAKNIDPRLLARRQTEAALARAGYPRSLRSDMLAQLMSNPAQRDAGHTAARDAGVNPASIRELIDILKS